MSQAPGSVPVNRRGITPMTANSAMRKAARMNRGSRRSFFQTSPHSVASRCPSSNAGGVAGSSPICRWSAISDPGIEGRAQDVDQEVREDEDEGRQSDQPDDHGAVLRADAKHE